MEIDSELLSIVSEDLDFLTKHWGTEIDDPSLRRGTSILRYLLIDKQLIKVAKMLEHEIYVMSPDPLVLESFLNDPDTTFYQACGAKYGNANLRGFSGTNRSLSREEIKDQYEKYNGASEYNCRIRLSVFMKQISFKFSRIMINREEVIKYVANKRGGVHYDPTRSVNTLKPKSELEIKYSLLDKLYESRVSVAGKNALYYEVLSIGQQIIESSDVQNLRIKLKSMSDS